MAEVEQTLAPFDPEPVPYDLKRSQLALPVQPEVPAPMPTARVDALPEPKRAGWSKSRSAVVSALAVVAIVGAVALVRGRPAGTHAAEASVLHSTTPAPAPTLGAPAAPVPATIKLHLVATMPGAQVELRGKTFDLPFHAEIPRGSVPEVVRVTAPKYQGRQYWVTLDQPRYMAIDLRPGSGVAEATAGETAVALGEAAPTEHASPAAVVVYRDRVVPATHGAATPAVAQMPNLMPPAQPAAPPPATAAAAPKPVAAAAPAPAAAPKPAAPATAAAPAPAPEHTPSFVTAPPPAAPKAPSTPVVPYGSFIASHKIAGDEPHLPPALRSSLAESQALARVCIAADGNVQETRVMRSPSAAADDAIRSALRGWKFRPFILQGKPSPLCFDLPISFKRQ
jgi:TonB-like protein